LITRDGEPQPLQNSIENHNRKSIRLNGHDYSTPGAYFITVVTKDRICLFGNIENGEMHLSALGMIVREEWFKTAILRPYVHLFEEEFVIMPNHVHGIIWLIDDELVGVRRRRTPTEEQYGKPVVGSIPTILRAFKSSVTYRAGRELYITKIWQRNYYEHIIRDQNDLENIANYIQSNPYNWENDAENQTNPSARSKRKDH